MEISLEKNETEAQSEIPQAGNEEVLDTVSSACRGQWAPKGHPKGCRLQTFLVFPWPHRPSQGQSYVGGMPVTFQRPILPGKYEHISASKKQIRIKFWFLCLVLFKEANLPMGEAVPGVLPAWKVGKPPVPAWDLPGTTPASAQTRGRTKANMISKGFASIQWKQSPPPGNAPVVPWIRLYWAPCPQKHLLYKGTAKAGSWRRTAGGQQVCLYG